MLKLTGLTRNFGAIKVINGLDLDVEAGIVLGILGPNGAGKTTLFNLILGVHAPLEGQILFEGRDITNARPWTRCRAGMGRTYQVPKPFSHMSVYENVLVAAVSGGRKSISASRDWSVEVLELTGLAHRMNDFAGTLSLLDLKRLELAKALASRPRLLMMDEIAGGLTDPECGELLEIIAEVHRQGTTILWIEHVIHALRRGATELAVLYEGRILSRGTPSQVLGDPKVQEIYLGVED